MYLSRLIDIKKIIKSKSSFLLGPRQVGKSTLIRETLPEALKVNLLLNETYLAFTQHPRMLREIVTKPDQLVVIDEIQRLPDLLNEVHYLIEEKNIKFLLTGSSARKLRHKGVNLLGGRARLHHMHPLTAIEIGDSFDLLRGLNYGMMPSIYLSDEPELDLQSYIGMYLKEEIAAEALTRKVDAYSRFLQVAALSNGQIVNYSNIANDAQVPRTTVMEYFQILIDTLLANWLQPWTKTMKRKPLATNKFYFFDPGVCGALQNRGKIKAKSPGFGEAFESYLHHEIRTYIDYTRPTSLHYWQSTSGFEVDFIFDERIAIEAKGKSQVSDKDLKGIRALKEEGILKNYYVVTTEERLRKTEDGITLIPWKDFVTGLWNGLLD